MACLRAVVPDGSPLLDEVGMENQPNSHFPGICYNILTSNSVESINALLRYPRKLLIVTLMDYFREFQQEWYFKRRPRGGHNRYKSRFNFIFVYCNLTFLCSVTNIKCLFLMTKAMTGVLAKLPTKIVKRR